MGVPNLKQLHRRAWIRWMNTTVISNKNRAAIRNFAFAKSNKTPTRRTMDFALFSLIIGQFTQPCLTDQRFPAAVLKKA